MRAGLRASERARARLVTRGAQGSFRSRTEDIRAPAHVLRASPATPHAPLRQHARVWQIRAAHAPLATKGRPMRTSKWRFAVARGRHQPRSLAQRQHSSRSSHERLEPSATAGDHSDAARVLTKTHASPHRVKPDFQVASASSGSRHLRTFVPIRRARIARQTCGAHR